MHCPCLISVLLQALLPGSVFIFQGRWFYALLACLEKPLHPEACALIRNLARHCASLRASLVSLNWLEYSLFLTMYLIIVKIYNALPKLINRRSFIDCEQHLGYVNLLVNTMENNQTVLQYLARYFYCVFELSYNVLGLTQNCAQFVGSGLMGVKALT